MREALVSIVIPCYQQEQYLSAAIDSVLRQTYRNLQVIVVNDGSTDGSHEVACRYRDSILYINQANAGVTAARNCGADVAEGRFLVFLDADDILDHRAVEWHLEGMKDIDSRLTVLGHQSFVKEPRINTTPPPLHFTVQPSLPALIHRNLGPPFTFMCSRRYFRLAGGFQLHSWGCEDWDLWTRLALCGVDIAKSDVVGGYWRRTRESRTYDIDAMFGSRCEHLTNLHAHIVANEELLQMLGAELLLAEQKLLRRMLVQKIRHDHVAAVVRMIRELYALGINCNRSRFKRLLNSTIGHRSEILALWQLRLTKPTKIERYRHGMC